MIKLFIARIPYSLTSEMLLELFSPFGQVHSAQVSVNSFSLESLGCGYVVMANMYEGQTAITELDGLVLQGRKIGVSKANTQRKKICM